MSMSRTIYSKVEQGYLTRTNGCTYASYWGDGQGRDSYIVTNNGGNTTMNKNGMQNRKNRAPRELQPAPCKAPAALIYRADGTGRDNYVLKNSGGLTKEHRMDPVHGTYQTSLRGYDPIPRKMATMAPSVDITEFNHWYLPKAKATFAKEGRD